MIIVSYLLVNTALLFGSCQTSGDHQNDWQAEMRRVKPKASDSKRKLPPSVAVRFSDPQETSEEQRQAMMAISRRRTEAFDRGLALYDEGRFADAAARIEAFLATGEWPDHSMKALLVDCYGALGAWRDAYAYISTFIADAAEPELLLRAVLVSGKCNVVLGGQLRYANYFVLDRKDAFRTAARSVLPWDETPSSLIFSSSVALADLQHSEGRWREAVRLNRMALAEKANNWLVQLQLGEALSQGGRYADAVPLLQRVRDLNPQGFLRFHVDDKLYYAREMAKKL